MTDSANKLVQILFQKENLEQCSIEELKALADRYPFSAPLCLLLTKKMEGQAPAEYKSQLQMASMHFSNPMKLEGWLNEESGTAEVSKHNIAQGQPDLPKNIDESISKPRDSVPEIPGLRMEPFDPNAAINLEPFHTVDYFASQGIKFKVEEKPKDKFGQQLKSFTEWIKTMKKLPFPSLESTADIPSEKKVEKLAEHSLEDSEVITEAMAEVWEKQGNQAKAIAIYNKLSLLEPAKSAYFAAQIERIKK